MSDVMYQPIDTVLQEMRVRSANNRRIIFDGEVNSDNVLKSVYYLQKLIDLDTKTGNKDDIHIEIHSFGGSIYDGVYLCDFIRYMQDKLGYKIIGTVNGYAMSMGFQILQSCTVRRCYHTSRLMFHQPSNYIYGDLENMERDLEETNYLWEEMKSLVKSRTLLTDDMMEEWKRLRKDKFFNREELIKYNIVDEVL